MRTTSHFFEQAASHVQSVAGGSITQNRGAASAKSEHVISVDLFLIDSATGKFKKITPEVLREARLKAFAEFGRKLGSESHRRGVVVMGMPCSGKSHFVKSQPEDGTLYFEATLSTKEERTLLMREAAKSGKPVELVHIRQDVGICAARNMERESHRQLPEDAMRGMLKRLHQQPPKLDEGWAAITRACPGPHGLLLDELLKRATHRQEKR